jgi:hypothetical protein
MIENNYNKNMLVGATIANVCKMTAEELDAHGWDDNRGFKPVYVIELDNGVSLYPSRDYEGNGGGAIFGLDENNEKCFTICERESPNHGEEIKVVDTTEMNNDEFGEYIRNCHK